MSKRTNKAIRGSYSTESPLELQQAGCTHKTMQVLRRVAKKGTARWAQLPACMSTQRRNPSETKVACAKKSITQEPRQMEWS